MNKFGCIYLLRNLVNGKGYVGQTRAKKVEGRWNAHIKESEKPRPKYPIHRAIKFHGVENFSAEVVWVGPVEFLNKKECHFVKKCNTFIDNGCGYNLTAGNGVGIEICKSTLKKRSAASNKLWAEPGRRERAGVVSSTRWKDPEFKAIQAKERKSRWEDSTFRAACTTGTKLRWKDPAYRSSMRKTSSAMWDKPGFRENQIAKRKARWADPIKREAQLLAIRTGTKLYRERTINEKAAGTIT